ncbi:MAG: hypothetical protein DMF82_03920 [Acidobacteria bacterium]|nr:MAG: hypothetical protein DMF82_03920 [Acidobacteriota bacterium]
MRAEVVLASGMLVTGAVSAPAAAQTVVELRASTTKYRFLDLSHAFANRVVLDALYLGVPGMNELYLGAGYQLRPATGISVAPLLYVVGGKENDVLGFAGHFFRTSGRVSDYRFVDALDLTRALGRWELGASAGAYHTSGDLTALAGPTVKRNDQRGSWAVSARFGSDTELRLLRILTF